MIFGVFVTLAALTLSPTPARATTFRRPRALVAVRHETRPRADDLYSARLRKRFAGYLRMRMLELREENLGRAAAVIERRLPVSALVEAPRVTPP